VDVSRLKDEFTRLFPESGAPFVCRVPGRVNLMGEHLDYNGLPVLPMAVDRALYVAFAPEGGNEIRMANLDDSYATTTFENMKDIAPSETGSWENYGKAAIAGINAHYSVTEFSGLTILVASDLPSSAGLSSSSALVVGCGMAYLAALGLTLGEDISRLEFAGVLANAEHYVGTAGGGMDQTVILNAEPGCATKINFIPYQVEHVPFPDDAVAIVCDSRVQATKTGDALKKYNAGPASCSLITALLGAHLCEEFGEDLTIECLGDLWFGPLCFTRAEVNDLFAKVLPDPLITPSEIAKRLQMPEAQLDEYWLHAIPFSHEGLPLQARARHVLSEYYRVEEGRDAMLSGDGVAFGQLMQGSHQSCATDYEISTPELDELCDLLHAAGCLGARMTGAGFGGSVVALAPAERAESIIREVHAQYYGALDAAEKASAVFQTRPCGDASYL
jgi:N-acetylgalactosamine kinase